MPQAPHTALNPLPGTSDLLRRGGRAGVSSPPRAHPRAGAGFAGSSGHRSAHAGALAAMVVGDVRPKLVLEAGQGPVHAPDLGENPAAVTGPSLWVGSSGAIAGVTQISVSPHDRFDPPGALLLREFLFPAQDAD